MSDDVEQPDSGQVPAQATQDTPNAGPWADDLALLFQDDATRAQVDQFIRAKVQPYTTKLEQDVATYRSQVDSDEYRAQQELYSAFQEDPNGTTATIIQQLYPQQAAEVLEFLNGQAAHDQFQQQEPQQMEMPPEFQNMYAQWEQQQATNAYLDQKNEFIAANPDFNPDMIDRFANYNSSDEGIDWAGVKSDYELAVATFTPQQKIDLGMEQTKAVESSDAKPDNAEEEYVYKKGDDPWEALKKGIKSIAPTTV